MNRLILMPDLEDSIKNKIWRRVVYSIVLTSVEFFLAIVAILTGIPVLLDPFTLSLVPNSVTQLLPLWMVDLWGFQLLAGGVVTVWGISLSDFRVEQIGVLLLMSGAFVYTIALVTLLPASYLAFITYILFVLTMGARYWVLGRLIKLTGRLKRHFLRERDLKEGE